MHSDRRLRVARIERHAGSVAPILALGGILLATILDPTFSWVHDALSDLGVRDASASVFNGSLVLGGLLAVIYGVGIARRTESIVQRLIGVLFSLAALHLAGVGLFVIGHPLHVPAAIGFYGLMTVIFLIDGYERREEPTGKLCFGLAAVHVAIWGTWFATWWPGTGLALPEFAGALLVPVWIWFVGTEPTLRSSTT